MIPHLLAVALALAGPLTQAASPGEITIKEYPIRFTHLSPLITYVPSTSPWNLTAQNATNDSPYPDADTSFSFNFLANRLSIVGRSPSSDRNKINAQITQGIDYSKEPNGTEGALKTGESSTAPGAENAGQTGPIVNLTLEKTEMEWRKMSIRPEKGFVLEKVEIAVPLGYDNPEGDNSGFKYAYDTPLNAVFNNTRSPAFYSPPSSAYPSEAFNDWFIVNSTNNATATPDRFNSAFEDALYNPSWGYPYSDPDQSFFPNQPLATNITGSPLLMDITGFYNNSIPDSSQTQSMGHGVSLIRIYGSVGPQMGRYGVNLTKSTSGSNGNTGFGSDVLSYETYDARRPVYSRGELLFWSVLDPRSTYTVGVELLPRQDPERDGQDQGQGLLLEIAGIAMTSYLYDAKNVKGSWVAAYNDGLLGGGGNGSSGGAIAGIVVGSVAGVILIGLLVWFLVRRSRRNKGAKAGDVRKDSMAERMI